MGGLLFVDKGEPVMDRLIFVGSFTGGLLAASPLSFLRAEIRDTGYRLPQWGII